MSARPVALYLTHFDVATMAHPLSASLESSDMSPLWTPNQDEDDSESLLLAEREAGRAEGAAAAQAEAAAERERAQQEFEEQLAAERQKWAQEEGEALKDRLATALQQIENDLAECVARVLRPFILDSLRQQMIGELVGHLGDIVASHDTTAIRIVGPADLLAILQDQLGELAVAITYEANDAVDVRVETGQTMIETRLKAWIDLVGAETEQQA